MNIEDWKQIGVEWQEDGSAIITLTFPINVGGTKSTRVQMHCPSLDQAGVIDADSGDSGLTRERRSIALLLGLAPEELGQVKFPDYRRLQRVYGVFFNGTPPQFIGAESVQKSGSSPVTSISQ